MTDVPTTPRRAMGRMRRLRIFEAGKGVCILCGLKIDGVREAWTVEHKIALGLGGEDTDENCGPAHERCRRTKDKQDVADISRAKRRKARHLGIKKPSGRPLMGTKASGWKIKMDRTVERRDG